MSCSIIANHINIRSTVAEDRGDLVILGPLKQADQRAKKRGLEDRHRDDLFELFSFAISYFAYSNIVPLLLNRYPFLATFRSVHYYKKNPINTTLSLNEGKNERSALHFFLASYVGSPDYYCCFESFLNLNPTFELIDTETEDNGQTPIQSKYLNFDFLSVIKKVYNDKIRDVLLIKEEMMNLNCLINFPSMLISLISNYAEPYLAIDRRFPQNIDRIGGYTPLGAAIDSIPSDNNYEERRKIIQIYIELGANSNLKLKDEDHSSSETIREWAIKNNSPFVSTLIQSDSLQNQTKSDSPQKLNQH